MVVLKKWFDFYVFSNIHVAMAVFCLTEITLWQYQMNSHYVAYFVFFSTVVSYNLIRAVQIDRINVTTAIWMRGNRKALLVVNAMALLGMAYFGLKMHLSGFLALLPFIGATVLYVLPLKGEVKGLRDVPGFKLVLISFCWAGVTVYFPLLESGIDHFSNMGIYFLQRFLFVLAITIPFDIRDAQFDPPRLATIPQVLGINNAKIIALIAIGICLGIAFFYYGSDSIYFRLDFLVFALSGLLIAFCHERRNRYYTAFWIEGIPLFWYGLLLLNKIL